MPDVLAPGELGSIADDTPPYTVHRRDSGWVLEIEGTPGVSLQQFVETEEEAHCRAAQLTLLMRHE
jgi:hypothetical protein